MIVIEPKDAMPWVGLYICATSLVCTLAMAADVFHGFRIGKLWFPCKFFTVNAVSITVIAIAMKLPVDLNALTPCEIFTKIVSILFLVTMVANFLPSMGLMGDKELLINIIALGILLITILVNLWVQSFSWEVIYLGGIVMLPCLFAFPVALTIPASRRNLELQYKELRGSASNHEEMNFSYKELVNYVKMYWMMAETGFKWGSKASNDYVSREEVETYSKYALLAEEEAELSERILTNTLRSIAKLIKVSAENEPRNLIKFLDNSRGFNGVIEFDDDEVPPLYPEETHNCWSLVAVTLTTIAIALPNIPNSQVKELLASMREGLQIVRNIEETLNENADLVEARKAAKLLWTEAEVYNKWLQIDLRNKSSKGKSTKKILQSLGDEAVKNVIEFKSCKKGRLNRSRYKFIASSSMYRISQTILLHCNKQENWPNDGKLFEWISTIIADLLYACFTNLPRVIKTKCHHDAIEKRGDNIWKAAQLLGKSKTILKILEERQLPNLDMDSMAYINLWQALPKSQIPNCCTSSTRAQLTSSSPDELSLIVTVV